MSYTRQQVAGAIDHTLLKTTATEQDIVALCREAADLKVIAVCVPPSYVGTSKSALQGTGVRVATVIGFPNGYSSTDAKAHEAMVAVSEGADEVDMVIHIGRAKSGDWAYVQNDIARVVSASHSAAEKARCPVLVKVIIETAALTDDEKRKACEAAKAAGADFVKTSTGFGGGGATVEDVRLMRSVVGQAMGVKASGGVRTLQQAEAMLDAGATRLGTSSGAAIMREIEERLR